MTTLCEQFNHLIGMLVPFQIWRVNARSIPLFCISRTKEWPMSSLKFLCVITYISGIRDTFRIISFLCLIMSLNIDMNGILPSNCSGFICPVFKAFWICLRISIDVNPGKYSTRTQFVLHQFHTLLRTRWIDGNSESVLSTGRVLLKDDLFSQTPD